MDQEQETLEAILQDIIDLAHFLGWSAASVENKDGELVGMYIGLPSWLKGKTGSRHDKPTH